MTDNPSITLGDLIAALEKEPKENFITFDFCGLIPRDVESYRGDYSHLAISWIDYLGLSDEEQHKTRVGGFLNTLKGAVGKVFVGYKGGNYEADLSTPIWVDHIGDCSSTRIVNVENFDCYTVINTKHQPG